MKTQHQVLDLHLKLKKLQICSLPAQKEWHRHVTNTVNGTKHNQWQQIKMTTCACKIRHVTNLNLFSIHEFNN